MTTVALTDAALEKIAFDRALEKAFGDGDYYAGCPIRVGPDKIFAPEAAVGETLSVFKESGHRELTTQTSTFGKGFIHYYFRLSKYSSMARATEGASGVGALTSILRPASSIAVTIDFPKETILMSPCSKPGKFSCKDLTSAGL